jgi:hypothetical protein
VGVLRLYIDARLSYRSGSRLVETSIRRLSGGKGRTRPLEAFKRFLGGFAIILEDVELSNCLLAGALHLTSGEDYEVDLVDLQVLKKVEILTHFDF